MKRMRTWLAVSALMLPLAAAASRPQAWYDGPLRPQLDRSIARFFGHARGPDLPMGALRQRHPLLADRFIEVFDQVPGEARVLPGGEVMYDACQVHNCALAVAVVVGQGRQVIAAAITHWRCGSPSLPADRPAGPDGPARAGGCDDPAWPTLTVLRRGARDPQALAALTDWGRNHLRRMALGPIHLRVQYGQVVP